MGGGVPTQNNFHYKKKHEVGDFFGCEKHPNYFKERDIFKKPPTFSRNDALE